MKIQDTGSLGAASAPGAQAAVSADSSGRKEVSLGVNAGDDTAEISGLAGKISQAVTQESAARSEKVEQLRAAVASNNYQADAAATSQAIVKDALANAAGSGGSSQT